MVVGPGFYILGQLAGLLAIAFVLAVLYGVVRGTEDPKALGGVLVGGTMGVGLWFICTRDLRRRRRYGESVCRLITLPGVVGGWFKADIECGLPPGTAVYVRLRNYRLRRELWQMAARAVARPGSAAGRSVIPVRLQVPLHAGQEPIVFVPKWSATRSATGPAAWMLEVESRGLQFSAGFRVPIFETPYGNPDEQRPD